MMRPALLDLSLDDGTLVAATVSLGFSEPVARAGLSAELEAWCTPGAVDAVLGELAVADVQPERLPGAVLVIAARTLPVSTMRAVLMARLLGARVVLKPASGQEAVATALAAADPAVEVAGFSSSDLAARARVIEACDAVVVLGSDATIAAVRAATPAHKAFVGYGHRVSAAWLQAPDDAALRGLAADLCAWDQAGCLSPQVVWISQADPESAADRLTAAVAELEVALPMAMDPARARERHAALTRAQMLGRARETGTAVIATLPSSRFVGSPGSRFLWVLPAASSAPDAIVATVSTLAVHGGAPDLPAAVRRCEPGEMQRPPLTWPHDGGPNLLPMLRPGR